VSAVAATRGPSTLTSRAAIHGAARVDARTSYAGVPLTPARIEPARPLGVGGARPPVASSDRGGRVPSTLTAATLRAFAVEVDALRGGGLTADEVADLDLLAFGWQRQRERRAEDAALRRASVEVARMREPALIASMSAPDAAVQPWAGVIGAEGQLTGDGRLIRHDALTWADFPLPLRYAPADLGGHDSAVLVGRIDSVTRGDDGLIRAAGVLDLGSEIGREVARLIGAGMLSGVSMDLDQTTNLPVEVGGALASLVAAGRVRAATLVSIPAFDVARIALVSDPDDCGCEPVAHPGSYHLTAA
jgi:hypothetical protein